tara:strand:+ start:51 stop:539 length:489 start_codon:yes stop_codon:yes gene_type:complete
MTSKLLVDSIEGRTTHGFLTPDRPAFKAYHSVASGAHQEVTHNTYVILPLNATDFNIGGHFNTSTYKFTAPTGGIYYFYAQVYQDKAGGIRYVAIFKGSTNVARSQSQSSTNDDATATVSQLLQLNAGDTVSSYVYHATDTSSSYYTGGDGSYTYFMGYLVG